jgi:hypothetical protein
MGVGDEGGGGGGQEKRRTEEGFVFNEHIRVRLGMPE